MSAKTQKFPSKCEQMNLLQSSQFNWTTSLNTKKDFQSSQFDIQYNIKMENSALLNYEGNMKSGAETDSKVKHSEQLKSEKSTSGLSPLRIAIILGNLDRVRLLLDNGADVDEADEDEDTALLIASQTDHHQIVEVLVSRGANVNKQNRVGVTSLLRAATKGNLRIVKYLITAGANLDTCNKLGQTALMASIAMGHSKVALHLIKKGATFCKPDPLNRLTPLAIACYKNLTSVALTLIDKKVNINVRDTEGRTPVILAAYQGNAAILKSLIAEGANLDDQEPDGFNALLFATQNGHLEAVTTLLENGASVNAANMQGVSSLHLAIASKNTDLVTILLQYGADPDAQNSFGHIPLVMAIQSQSKGIINLLLEKADVNIMDGNHNHPLIVAAFLGQISTVQSLVYHNAEVDAVDDDGDTAFMMAVLEEFFDTAKFLLEKKANINQKNFQGITSLHRACLKGNFPMVQFLCENNADVNCLDLTLTSPLHLAAASGSTEIIMYLISLGAKITSNNEGVTPIVNAAILGHLEALKYLHSKGSKLDGPLMDGNTLLHFAVQEGQSKITEYLIANRLNLEARCSETRLTPLMIAAYHGKVEVLRLLLDAGADVDSEEQIGDTALSFAAQEGRLECVQELLKSKSNPLHLNHINITPIDRATQNGHMKIVALLKLANMNFSFDLENKIEVVEEQCAFVSDHVFKKGCSMKQQINREVKMAAEVEPKLCDEESIEEKDEVVCFALKLGLDPDYVANLKEDFMDLEYYPDLGSHFVSTLAHQLSGTEVIDPTMNITEILHDVGFTLETSSHLQTVIKKDSLDLTLFHWINCYVSEKLTDDALPGWITTPGTLRDELTQQISTSAPHFANGQINLNYSWINFDNLQQYITDHGNTGLSTDEYWYHSTSDKWAIDILSNGINFEASLSNLLHLGKGFYVSNNFSSAERYLKKAVRPGNRKVWAVFVFHWNLDKQTEYNDRRLNVIGTNGSTNHKQNEKIVKYFTNKRRPTEPNIEAHGLPHNYNELYSMIMARDTGDRSSATYADENKNQMCIRKTSAVIII